MTPRGNPELEPRKVPVQARSRLMRDRIVAAAIRVLGADGPLGFTTTRVAEEAGISVGSLYQYFPNKHAIALAVHERGVEEAWTEVERILDDPARSVRRKLVTLAQWFFATEGDEVRELGAVFDDAEVFLRNGGTHPDVGARALRRFTVLLGAESGSRRPRDDALFLMTTLESVGKAAAALPLSRRERQRWATMTATMLCDHLGIAEP